MKRIIIFLVSVFMISLSAQIPLEGDITTNQTLTSSNTYLLKGFVRVQPGAVLIIEPGTIIYGENASQGTLIIKPGAQIIAEGTVQQPIIFTSEFNKEGSQRTPTYGDWGGVIILGHAPINVPGGTAAIEGPGDSFGGTNSDDNSGTLKYVRIEYPGIAFSPNNEINGLTLGGVGRLTTIEYVQVSYSGDDSFEWFGGNVNAKYLIAYKGWDDDFDTDFGYSGKLQFILGIRDPEIADVSGSNGFESDNDGSGSLNEPRTSPTWWNVTLIGPKASSSTPVNSNFKRGMHLRRSSQNKINNALIMGYPTGILLDGSTTISDAITENTYIKNSIISGADKALDTAKTNGSFDVTAWFTSTHGGRILSENSETMLTGAFNLENPNPLPLNGSPVLLYNSFPPNDGFFDTSATFIGAFGFENWTKDWSYFNTTVDVLENDSNVPDQFSLLQNYPNPFNPSTMIEYSLAKAGYVKLSIFNILGQEIAVLVNDFQNAGTYKVNFNASGLSSGLYIYKLQAGSVNLSRTLSLVK